MNSKPELSHLNKSFYTKLSATATRQFSEEMQKRRKPFLLNETEPINFKITRTDSNKENWRRPYSPYNKIYLNKSLQLPGKNVTSTAVYRTEMNSYHTLREIEPSNSNYRRSYLACSRGKSEIENIPMKPGYGVKETVFDSNYRDKTSLKLCQAPLETTDNQDFSSDVEELLKMHIQMIELKQKLEEKYNNTLKQSHQLISYGTAENETPFSLKINPSLHSFLKSKNLKESLEPAVLQTLSAATREIETQSQEGLPMISSNEIISKETSEQSLITTLAFNPRKETLIKKVNLLRHIMLLISNPTTGNETSGCQSVTEEEFNSYKIEPVINSTPITTRAANGNGTRGQPDHYKPIERNNSDTFSYQSLCMGNKMIDNRNNGTEDESFKSITNALMLTTLETKGNETPNKANSIAARKEAKSSLITASCHSLFALDEVLKNAKALGENLKLLTDISACSEDINGIEISCSKSLSPLTKEGNKMESINELPKLTFLVVPETSGNEIAEINSSDNLTEDKGLQITNISEETSVTEKAEINRSKNLTEDKGLKSTNASKETSGIEITEINSSENLNKDVGLQITVSFRETSGIDTPRYLTQLRAELNKVKKLNVDKWESNGNETIEKLQPRNPRLSSNLPHIYNNMEAISQIPKDIIKISKRYMPYGAKATEIVFKNKKNKIEIEGGNGDNGLKQSQIGENSQVELKIPRKPLHNLKHYVNSKECINEKLKIFQREHNEMKQITERKNKTVIELVDEAETKAFHHLRQCEETKDKLPKQCGNKPNSVVTYGGMLYGLWNAVKRYPFEARVNITINENKRIGEGKANRQQSSNREMEIENEKIHEREKMLKNKVESVGQPDELAKKQFEKQGAMPKGNKYLNVRKIPRKTSNFKNSLRNYFSKEEKTAVTVNKDREEDCVEEENDSDRHYEIVSLGEKWQELFHI